AAGRRDGRFDELALAALGNVGPQDHETVANRRGIAERALRHIEDRAAVRPRRRPVDHHQFQLAHTGLRIVDRVQVLAGVAVYADRPVAVGDRRRYLDRPRRNVEPAEGVADVRAGLDQDRWS